MPPSLTSVFHPLLPSPPLPGEAHLHCPRWVPSLVLSCWRWRRGRNIARAEAQDVFLLSGHVGGFHQEGERGFLGTFPSLTVGSSWPGLRLALAVISLRISYRSWYPPPSILSRAICVSRGGGIHITKELQPLGYRRESDSVQEQTIRVTGTQDGALDLAGYSGFWVRCLRSIRQASPWLTRSLWEPG